MDHSELGTFIQKFRSLWKCGLDDHLDLDTSAEQAWVGLRVPLGHAPGPYHVIPHHAYQKKNRNSPSRERRRVRRAADRAAKAGEAETLEENENNAEEANLENLDQETEPKETQSDMQEEVTLDIIEDEIMEENMNQTAEEVSNTVSVEKETTAVTADDCDDLLSDDVAVSEETVEEVDKVNNVVVVHATATFEECPDAQLYQDYVESLERFIFNKDHLKRNICKVETSYISSREFRHNTYTHTMSVRLFVLTGGLWEGPRSYIWKHLGDDVWTRGNNTKIRLVRIHVK